MSEEKSYGVLGVFILVSVMLFIFFIYVKNSLERGRSIVFERDEAGRITAIHYV
jgi:hypothetical protein